MVGIVGRVVRPAYCPSRASTNHTHCLARHLSQLGTAGAGTGADGDGVRMVGCGDNRERRGIGIACEFACLSGPCGTVSRESASILRSPAATLLRMAGSSKDWVTAVPTTKTVPRGSLPEKIDR